MSENEAQPISLQELPEACDTCETTGPFEPISKIRKTWMGEVKVIVGYTCPHCETTHLYQ